VSIREVKARTIQSIAIAAGRSDDPYVLDARENFVRSVNESQIDEVLKQVGGGDGSELKRKDGRIKFGAAHSSSALAANAFGAWVDQTEGLNVAGIGGFSEIGFEEKFPTGLNGKAPNLDVWLPSNENPVAIESKFTEYLESKKADFKDSYEGLVGEVAHQSWASVYRDLKLNPRRYERIDVAQLVKHYLGLRKAIQGGRFGAVTLVYLFWEPTNATDFDEFAAHRNDLDEIISRVDDPAVSFRSLSYPELWEEWSSGDQPGWLPGHVAELRARYEIAI